MSTQIRFFLLLIVFATFAGSAGAAAPSYLYQAKLVQAAPGKLLELIELQKSRLTEYRNAGDDQPLMMRHSQGDRWDLLVLIPMKSYIDYYSPERVAKRKILKES